MYNTNELKDAIRENNETIKHLTARAKKAEKILHLIAEYEKEYDTILPSINAVIGQTVECQEKIDLFKSYNVKRKKQLALMEQLEALDNE